MEAKISKAQLEVWEWKEKLSSELLKIPLKDRSKYITEKAKKARKKIENYLAKGEEKVAI